MSLINQLHPHLLDKEAMADILVLQNLLKIFHFLKSQLQLMLSLSNPTCIDRRNYIIFYFNTQIDKRRRNSYLIPFVCCPLCSLSTLTRLHCK